MKLLFLVVLLHLIYPISASATVVVNSPSNGDAVGSNVRYVAKAQTNTCSNGVASIGVYVDNQFDSFRE
jgi:hypothetical protein